MASERLAFLAGKRLYSTVNRDVAAWIQTPSAHIPVGRIRATKEIDLLQMHAARGDTLQVGGPGLSTFMAGLAGDRRVELAQQPQAAATASCRAFR